MKKTRIPQPGPKKYPSKKESWKKFEVAMGEVNVCRGITPSLQSKVTLSVNDYGVLLVGILVGKQAIRGIVRRIRKV